MRCKIIRSEDGYVLNIRHTDEIAEDYNLSDADAEDMERHLKAQGRYWLDADTVAMPIRLN